MNDLIDKKRRISTRALDEGDFLVSVWNDAVATAEIPRLCKASQAVSPSTTKRGAERSEDARCSVP